MSDRSIPQFPPELHQELAHKKKMLDEQKQNLQERIARQCRHHYHDRLIEAERESVDDPETYAQERVNEFAEQLSDESAFEFERLETEWNEAVKQAVQIDISDNERAHNGIYATNDNTAPMELPVPPSHCAQTPVDFLAGTDHIEKRGSKKRLKQQRGLLVVQSAADVERLRASGILSVGLARPQHTPEQVERIIALAKKYAEAKVQTWLPLDEAGRLAMWKLVQALLPEVFVRVPITSKSDRGMYVGKSPADLSDEQLETAHRLLITS